MYNQAFLNKLIEILKHSLIFTIAMNLISKKQATGYTGIKNIHRVYR